MFGDQKQTSRKSIISFGGGCNKVRGDQTIEPTCQIGSSVCKYSIHKEEKKLFARARSSIYRSCLTFREMQASFGSNPNNRFSNVSILSQQQQNGQNMQATSQMYPQPLFGQQQPQQQQQKFQQPVGQSSLGFQSRISPGISQNYIAPFQAGVGGEQLVEQKDPLWFDNPKKRVIPQNIVKRSVRSSSSTERSQSSRRMSTTATRFGFDVATFGTRKSANIFNTSSSAGAKDAMTSDDIFTDSNEAPPLVSINDWQREDEFDTFTALPSNLNRRQQQQQRRQQLLNDSPNYNSTPIPTSRPGAATNVFDKGYNTEENVPARTDNRIPSLAINDNPTNANTLSNYDNSMLATPSKQMNTSMTSRLFSLSTSKIKPTLPKPNSVDSAAGATQLQSSRNQEAAVIVFGYPESVSNAVVLHFSHFGNILEDFEVLRSPSGLNTATLKTINRPKKQNKPVSPSSGEGNSGIKSLNDNAGEQSGENRKYPIYTGEGWVKLTYNSQTSALRALQENGTIFAGSLIGCIPYSKVAVERLASCRIDKIDNIGEGTIFARNTLSVSNQFDANSNINVGGSPNRSILMDNGLADISVDSVQDTTFTSINREGGNFGGSLGNKNKLVEGGNAPSKPDVLYPNHVLNIKDGRYLFVENADDRNRNLLQILENKMRQHGSGSTQGGPTTENGLLDKVSNWIFGWNNL